MMMQKEKHYGEMYGYKHKHAGDIIQSPGLCEGDEGSALFHTFTVDGKIRNVAIGLASSPYDQLFCGGLNNPYFFVRLTCSLIVFISIFLFLG